MKRTVLTVLFLCMYLFTFPIQAYAGEDWHQIDIPSYSDMTTMILGSTVDDLGNLYMVYSVSDPTGETMPFPMAKVYDGTQWTQMGSGFIDDVSAGHCIMRYDSDANRLYVGLITINGVIHIYEFIDGEWAELGYVGRLLRIDPQYIYYDFEVMSDGSLIAAYVDIEEEGELTAKAYRDGEWKVLGKQGFNSDPASYVSLTVDPDSGTIFAGTIVERTYLKAWMYTEEAGWEVTDDSGFEAVYPYWVKMMMGNGNRPIMTYMDAEMEWKTSSLIYEEGTWRYLEPYPFSTAVVRTFGMTLDSDGWPVVTFNDSEHENKLTTMRYNGQNWETIGRRGFTPEGTNYVFTGMDSGTVPYVLFPALDSSGALVKMEYSEVTEAVGSEEVVVQEPNEEMKSEYPMVVQQESTEEESGSIMFIVIPIVIVLIVFIFWFLAKRRKKDEEEESTVKRD